MLKGLRSIFAEQREFEIVASCSSGKSCVEEIRKLTPDVALLANSLPDLTATAILATVKAENLPTRLLFFTEAEADDGLTAAIATGACSAISKYASAEALLRSLRLMSERVSSPELSPEENEVGGAKVERKLATLTDRERQIVQLVSIGLSNKEIARRLNVSRGTVKVHLYNIFQKLEVSNRTVLAAITLLKRPTGFGVLTLAALAFATMNDVKASDIDKSFLEDDGIAYKNLEHGLFKLSAMEAILRHITVGDPNVVITPKDSWDSAEELRAAQQSAPPNFARVYGPTGSSTPFGNIAHTTVEADVTRAGKPNATGSFSDSDVHNLVNVTTKARAGYGQAAAGVWICALDNFSAAVQALDLGKTLIDNSKLDILDGTSQGVTSTIRRAGDAAAQDFDNLAARPILDDSHTPIVFTSGHGSVAGEGSTVKMFHGGAGNDAIGVVDVNYEGSGNHTSKGYGGGDVIYEGGSDVINGRNGKDTGGYGDELTGSNGDDALSAIDSNSIQFDTTANFASGSDRINLAAFGALAYLHLTPTGTSVPPHTLAWIYNAATNETIVYVNQTDGSLDIGDVGLLEIHLQGVVSVAESDFVYEPDSAAIAAAVKGIDPALLVNTASDGSVLTTVSASAASIDGADGDSALLTSWSMPDEGFRFRLGGDRIDSIASIKLTVFGDDQVDATIETDDRAITASTSGLSVDLVHGHATVLIDEEFTFGQELIHASTGATTVEHANGHASAKAPDFGGAAQNEVVVSTATIVESSPMPSNGNGHGNPQHAAQPAAVKAAAAEPNEPDLATGNGNAQGPQHAAHPAPVKSAAADPSEPDLTTGNGNHGNPQHAAQPAAVRAAAAGPTEPDLTTGNGNANGNPHHAAHHAAVKAAAAATEPAETLSGSSDGQLSAFHFNNQVAVSNNKAAPDGLGEPYVLLSHRAGLADLLEVAPAVGEEHAGSQVNNGQHHAVGHSPHDLLI